MSTRFLLCSTALTAALALGVAPAARAEEPTAAPPAGATVTAAPAAAHPDFSGHWKLDPKSSDDPARMGGGPAGPGGPGGPGGGRGGGPGGPGGGRGRNGPALDPNQGKMPGEGFDGSEGEAGERAQAAGRQAAREFGLLEIFHEGDEFDLTDGMQISRMLRIGGEPTEVFTPRGSVKAAAAWEGDALVVTERDPQGQVRRTRQFRITGDRSTLTVKEIRQLPGKEGNAVMSLVYRRVEPETKP
ncbi:MAG: hypothetical protein IPH48_11515 [bacterium]|nr:hypothetical protein [bacterium]